MAATDYSELKATKSESQLLRHFRRRPLLGNDERAQLCEVRGRRDDIRRILPHRPPLLFVDSVDAVSADRETIVGTRVFRDDDPVFTGHFPGNPVYPGTFQVEAIGQLGLCLWYFRLNPERLEIATDSEPVSAFATRIGGAMFSAPVRPGTTAQLVARRLEGDEMRGSMIGQLIIDDTVCTTAIGEVVFP
ncbi:MAG: 3-hydroxyacyl-ACP dehydratase FabZ family protein [Spirochaetia bacterium]